MLPSRDTSDAPCDSSAKVGPLNCFTENRRAPRSQIGYHTEKAHGELWQKSLWTADDDVLIEHP